MIEPSEEPEAGSLRHAMRLVRAEFDGELYAREYRDLQGLAAEGGDALLEHFCERGWREGRNPNAAFDTVSYLLTHTDVTRSGLNPFYHYLLAGRRENRAVTTAYMPSGVAQRAFGHDPGDWVTLLRSSVDIAFYAGTLPDSAAALDPVAHYAYFGWLEGRDPNPNFNVRAALARHPHLRHDRLNPLLVQIVAPLPPPPPPPDEDDGTLRFNRWPRSALFGIGERLRDLRLALAPPGAMVADASRYTDPVEHVVAAHLDPGYYLVTYPDIGVHNADPVHHYCKLGWTERRNPADWFDTSYYLEANTDVGANQLNPFWHYLVAGRAEGRSPRRPGGSRREVIDRAVDPDVATADYARPALTGKLSRAKLERLLRAACTRATGLVLSVSHDCYIRVTGGIQVFIADEQAAFARQGWSYLNLSPFHALLRLAGPDDRGLMANLVLDGVFLGVASYDELAAALRRVVPRPGERRLFLVHCLLGHQLQDLLALQRASGSTTDVFWLHDYSSLCVGFNLLRNDAAYCHAPPADSMACRICVYGERRAGHLEQMQAFFEAIRFQVVAPSRAALDVWLAHSPLPYASAASHEHAHLALEDHGAARTSQAPVRIAFIGYPRPHKGWPIWRELVGRTQRLCAYEFLHLGSPAAALPLTGVAYHEVSTSRAEPDAMSDAVARLDIDLVLVLSTWPETFSYVTFEALAGGADVVCLGDSGNVADTVLRQRRGVVAQDEASLFAFFESLRAVEYVRLCREQTTPRGRLMREGTTATLDMVVNP